MSEDRAMRVSDGTLHQFVVSIFTDFNVGCVPLQKVLVDALTAAGLDARVALDRQFPGAVNLHSIARTDGTPG